MTGVTWSRSGLKLRLSIPDFISQLWRKSYLFPKLQENIWNGKSGFEEELIALLSLLRTWTMATYYEVFFLI